MEKSAFEQMGGTYTRQGDYLLPDLSLVPQEERPIGVWGERRRKYLKEHRRVLYYSLFTSGNLHSHLADVEGQAQENVRAAGEADGGKAGRDRGTESRRYDGVGS